MIRLVAHGFLLMSLKSLTRSHRKSLGEIRTLLSYIASINPLPIPFLGGVDFSFTWDIRCNNGKTFVAFVFDKYIHKSRGNLG